MAQRDYEGDGIVVHWDSTICMHSARCFGALPSVFRPSDKPWVQFGETGADAVAAAIDLCPSGALRYTRTSPGTPSDQSDRPDPSDQLEENPAMTAEPGTADPAAPAPAKLTVYADGPNVLVGAVEIRNGAGELIKTVERVSLCRCGHSENKPFCDGSHKRVGFTDPGPTAPEAQ